MGKTESEKAQINIQIHYTNMEVQIKRIIENPNHCIGSHYVEINVYGNFSLAPQAPLESIHSKKILKTR